MAIIRPKGSGNNINQENLLTYNTEDLLEYTNSNPYYSDKIGVYEPSYISNLVLDFRQNIRKRIASNVKATENAKTVLSNSLPYGARLLPNGTLTPSQYNLENRVNLGDPGNPMGKDLTSYVSGGYYDGTRWTGAASEFSFDKINASGLNGNPSFDGEYQDLVKFGIGVYGGGTFLNFRAFLNQISDSYTSEWTDTKYVGRGEKFYTYTGFDRKISLSWTVAAQSKIELLPMYKKLNYLASMCAPKYTSKNYMTGNILTLTVGGYVFNQPGILTGVSFEMNDDNATWEIAVSEQDYTTGGIKAEDPSIKELPHLIKVTSFEFIPIHTFVPQLGQQFIVP